MEWSLNNNSMCFFFSFNSNIQMFSCNPNYYL
jgi:hypothetical protein